MHLPTAQATEQAARASYGRLVAWLAYQWRDLEAAQDAMSTALTKALELWPVHGVPDKPDAWLLSVAKRELLQAARRQRLDSSPEVQALLQDDAFDEDAPAVPDARLKLLFVCAHPAIDVTVRPALMLQTVLGLEAGVIAQAMLTSPKAMAQRLVRAKRKIRDAGLHFEEPDADDLPDRLHSVLEAIYAAYGLGWDALDGGDEQTTGLRAEALFLGDLICALLPSEAEAKGLLALMLFCESRVAARYTASGQFVPLTEQDTQRWDLAAIAQAEHLLRRAAQANKPGPFQWEAAIQSAHCQRHFTGSTPWAAIALLYQHLLTVAPSLGAEVAQSVALANSDNVPQAQALLHQLNHAHLQSYQPYWVAKAHVARLAGQPSDQAKSLAMAIGLTTSPSVRHYLMAQLPSGS